MLSALTISDSERIRELRLTAKWGLDNEEKRRAIFGLLKYGNAGLASIREVLDVTAYNDIKQACIDAIKSVGRKQMKTLNKDGNSSKKNRKPSTAKRKNTFRKKTKNAR